MRHYTTKLSPILVQRTSITKSTRINITLSSHRSYLIVQCIAFLNNRPNAYTSRYIGIYNSISTSYLILLYFHQLSHTTLFQPVISYYSISTSYLILLYINQLSHTTLFQPVTTHPFQCCISYLNGLPFALKYEAYTHLTEMVTYSVSKKLSSKNHK